MHREVGGVEVVAISLVAGQCLPAGFGLGALIGGVVLAVLAMLLRQVAARQDRVLARAAVALGVAALGSALATAGQAIPRDPAHVRRLPLPWRGEVTAVVLDGPWRAGDRARLLVDVQATKHAGAWRAARGRALIWSYRAVPNLAPGVRFRARVGLRAPRNFRTPGTYDWSGSLARRAIHVTGSIGAGASVVVLPPGDGGLDPADRWRAWIGRWRRQVAERIERLLPEGERRSVLLALVVGDRSEVDDGLRERFARAGVAHVLAISGLHVGIVVWASATVLGVLLRRSGACASWIDVRAIAIVLAGVPAGVYAALGGLGPSVLRAFAAFAVVALARVADRRAGPLRVIALVVIVLAVVSPGIARDVGFQLSLAAVLGLVAGAAGRRGTLRQVAGASLGAWAATAPLVAHYFQQVAFAAPLASPVVTPLFGLGPVGAGVAGALALPVAPAAADVCFRLADLLLVPGTVLVDRIASVPGTLPNVPRPSGGEVVALYVGAALVRWGRGRVRRGLVAALVVLALLDVGWWIRARWAPGRLHAAFLDVGQGDAAVVELPDGRVMVVDAGGLVGSRLDIGRAVVAPYLRSRKIGRVDLVVMTHAHPDHAGGLAAVIAGFRPRELWWPGIGTSGAWRRARRAARATGTRIRRVGAGLVVREGDVTVRVLHPPREDIRAMNDASVVLEIAWAGRRILLTGDVEAAGETAMLVAGLVQRADVVKVAHHGSRTSSGPAFVRAAAARVAVVSAGQDNRYGHPAPEVETRWRRAGACVLRTDRCGSVTVTVRAGGSLEVRAVDETCRCATDVSR